MQNNNSPYFSFSAHKENDNPPDFSFPELSNTANFSFSEPKKNNKLRYLSFFEHKEVINKLKVDNRISSIEEKQHFSKDSIKINKKQFINKTEINHLGDADHPLVSLSVHNLEDRNVLTSLISLIKSSATLRELTIYNCPRVNVLTLKDLLEAVSASRLRVFNYSDNSMTGTKNEVILLVSEFIKGKNNLCSLEYTSTTPLNFKQVTLINNALEVNRSLYNVKLDSDMETREGLDESVKLLSSLPNKNESIVNLDFRVSLSFSNYKYTKPFLTFTGSTMLFFMDPLLLRSKLKDNIGTQLCSIDDQTSKNWEGFVKNCKEIDHHINDRKLLPLEYNLKKIYSLLQQLKYITSDLINHPEHEKHYLFFCSVGLKLERYRLEHPYRVCGISQSYVQKDENKIFLPYELIVAIFGHLDDRFAFHINLKTEAISLNKSEGLSV